jgi:hypothetical protein
MFQTCSENTALPVKAELKYVVFLKRTDRFQKVLLTFHARFTKIWLTLGK